MSKKKLPSR